MAYYVGSLYLLLINDYKEKRCLQFTLENDRQMYIHIPLSFP